MSAGQEQKPGVFKEWIDGAFYLGVADDLAAADDRFDRSLFLQLTLKGLEDRELMDRLRQTAVAFQASLSLSYREQLAVLRTIAHPHGNSLVACWYADFVGQFGVDFPDISLPALAHFTRFGSAEFAVREFLLRDLPGTLQVMRTWSRDKNEHLRRLASEGCRPRLPWGKRLDALIEDPTPVLGILTALRDDPALYVRKSVANHLNDISKDHPMVVLDTVSAWDRSSPRTAWMVKQGLRTLVKQAHPTALKLMGMGDPPKLSAVGFKVSPSRVSLGERITLELAISSAVPTDQDLLIDYVIHYVKKSGAPRPKVFKWKRLRMKALESLELAKTQIIKDFSTRKHYAGDHRVEIQINGQRMAASKFKLQV